MQIQNHDEKTVHARQDGYFKKKVENNQVLVRILRNWDSRNQNPYECKWYNWHEKQLGGSAKN